MSVGVVIVGGGVEAVLPAGVACAQALSCHAEFSQRLDGEAEGHVDHVGPCRRLGDKVGGLIVHVGPYRWRGR
jgi:hypothetical protein